MRKLYAALLVAGVGGAIFAGHTIRSHFDIDLSPHGVHAWVGSLSWRGPLIFVGLLTFRQFLLLPSALLLSVGGLSFGAVFGTLLGALGILLSAVIKFGIARGVRLQWAGQPRRTARVDRILRRLNRAGPLVVGVATAHPMGPMAPFHWAAGLSSIPLAAFVLAVTVAGPIRAAAFAFLGSSFIASNPAQLYASFAVLAAFIFLPLLHPGLRGWLFAERDVRRRDMAAGGEAGQPRS